MDNAINQFISEYHRDQYPYQTAATDRAIPHPDSAFAPPTHKPKRDDTMANKLSSYAALVRDDITTLTVHAWGATKAYVFLCPKALADTLEAGDKVIVDTAQGLRVGDVDAVHSDTQVDPDSEIEYRWAFQKVDIPALEKEQETNARITEKLKARRKVTQRQQALAALGITDPQQFLADIKE